MDNASPTLNDDPPIEPPVPRRWGVLVRLGGMLWVAVLAWALHELHREWSGFHLVDLNAALARIGPRHLALALVFTALSYLCNAGLGLIAQRWLQHPPVPLWLDLTRNFIVSAFTTNAGGSVLGGGSIRLRFATDNGISPADVGKATAFGAGAGWAGHLLLCGLLLSLTAPSLGMLPGHLSRGVGLILLAAGLALPFVALVSPGAWPPPRTAWLTMAVAVLDWLFAGLTLWALFPDGVTMGVWSLVAVVAVAQALAAFTHVPGGVGVLELALTKALAASVAAPVLAGTLVTYRLVYYLLPFVAAILLLGWGEARRSSMIIRGSRLARRGWSMIAPRLAALLALAGGFMLLLSANTPMESSRRGLVALVPLPFVEASHFLSSLAGALLIVLARGLQRRVQTAWWLSVATMAGGIVFSLVKGFDWEESIILLVLLACLLSSRRHFHRHAALWTYRFTGEWWLLLGSMVAVSVWVGFFAARHVPYQHDLWWQFALESDASRFFRALLGAGCVFLIIGLAQALRPAKPRHPEPPPPDSVIDSLVQRSPHAAAALAWLGDKQFAVTEDGGSGLMFADRGRSRIVMGDPLGDSETAGDLIWRFVEQAQDEGMRPVFYQVSVAEMPRLVDMGFKLFKLGEEAIVPLAGFTLDTTEARKLRQIRSRFQRHGFQCRIWDADAVRAHLPTLQAISDAWLGDHRAGEKGFSLGRFDPAYLLHFNCAVVEDADGNVIAFANLWQAAASQELSIDLMRHLPDAPGGVMEGLFVELLLWGRDHGYARFNLGMAPLSGLSTHPLAPLWHKLASRLFERGGALYNFTGLRAYKEKFRPDWEPRYIAVPSTWSLPSALLDTTTLIGGGLRHTLGKPRE